VIGWTKAVVWGYTVEGRGGHSQREGREAMKRHKGRVNPYVESIVLCDDVHDASNTEGMPDGVFDLIHVRTTLQIPSGAAFPYRHSALGLYLRLCGRAGVVSGRVALRREGVRRRLWEYDLPGPIELWGFNTSAHYFTTLTDVEFPVAGVYWFRVRIGKDVLDQARLLVE
jgi:hypothetical protein